MSKCAACGRFVGSAEAVKCTRCGGVYERQCVKIPKSAKIPENWQCPGCVGKQPRNNGNETPVKGLAEPESSQSSDSKGELDVDSKTTGLEHELKLFRAELAAMRFEITHMGSKFDQLLCKVEGVNKRIDSVEERIAALEQRGVEEGAASGSNQELVTTIERLKMELNDRDQDLLHTDVEITGIQEVSGENTVHILTLVSEKLGVAIEERDVVNVERGGPRRGGAVEGAEERPRPLVVRLARRALRDQLLRAARVRRGADTAGMQLPGPPRKFYVNERLTRPNRQLFYKARQVAAQRRWKYVWTRNGRIFARRTTDSEARRIRTEADLTVVFGDGSIGH